MNFLETDQLHQNAERVAREGITVHRVGFPQLAEFKSAVSRYRQTLDLLDLQGEWRKLEEKLKSLHARMARSPCSPRWIAGTSWAREACDLLGKLKHGVAHQDPSLDDVFSRVDAAWNNLKEIDANPLANIAASLLSSEGACSAGLVVLRETELWGEARRALSALGVPTNVGFRRPSELRTDHPPVPGLLCFGPPHLLAYYHEEDLVVAPCSGKVHFVMCNHEYVGTLPWGGLPGARPVAVHIEGQAHAAEPDAFEPADEPSFIFKSGKYTVAEAQEAEGEYVRAYLIVLGEGEKGVYLREDSTVCEVKVGVSGDTRPCLGVDRIDSSECEPGMLLLLSTEGGGDMIPLVADMLLKDQAASIRDQQALWKARLKDQIERRGSAAVAAELREKGCVHANPVNLRVWSGPDSLGVDNLEENLPPILGLVGLAPRSDEIIEGIKMLRRVHKLAGRQLSWLLRRQLKNLDLRDVFLQGKQDLRDKNGGPVKTVFMISSIEDPVQVPKSLTNRLVDLAREDG